MHDEAETSDFAQVRRNPAAWYRDPQDILDDRQLRRSEKQALLDEWALDLSDRSVAADEGMVPETAGIVDRDVAMQDRVMAAQAALTDGTDDDAGNFVERLWRRITG